MIRHPFLCVVLFWGHRGSPCSGCRGQTVFAYGSERPSGVSCYSEFPFSVFLSEGSEFPVFTRLSSIIRGCGQETGMMQNTNVHRDYVIRGGGEAGVYADLRCLPRARRA